MRREREKEQLRAMNEAFDKFRKSEEIVHFCLFSACDRFRKRTITITITAPAAHPADRSDDRR